MAPTRLRLFLLELQRRKVIRVLLGYGVGAWIVVQGAANVLPLVGAPGWVGRAVVALVALGFPLALVLSWAYDATPHGLVRATAVGPELIAPAEAATPPHEIRLLVDPDIRIPPPLVCPLLPQIFPEIKLLSDE